MIIKNTKISGGQTLMTIEGMLDSTSAPQFQERVTELLKDDNLDLIVDLAELTYTSSQGIRTILSLIKTMKQRNARLIFRNICPAVREVLDMAGISQAMTIE